MVALGLFNGTEGCQCDVRGAMLNEKALIVPATVIEEAFRSILVCECQSPSASGRPIDQWCKANNFLSAVQVNNWILEVKESEVHGGGQLEWNKLAFQLREGAAVVWN